MKSAEKLTVATLAGLTMAATVAAPLAGVASENPAPSNPADSQPAGLEAQAATTLAAPTMVKAKAVGTFAYDQTSVSPKADLVRFQGASSVLCGAADAVSQVAARDWEITVSGAVVDQFTATVGELVGEEPVNQLMTCSCGGNPAGGRAIVTADVKGVPVEYLLAKAGAVPEANTLTFVGADGTSVSVPLGYAIGRHAVLSCEVNGEDLGASMGGANQLWMAKTPANYFVRDVVEIVVSVEDEVPAAPGTGVEHPNSPNAGILTGAQA